LLASRWGAPLTNEKFHAWFGRVEIRGEWVVLLKPTTFMNRSGQAVSDAGRFYKLDLPELVVIADDLALPIGRLRMRAGGSSGSHKGLQSVIDRVGSDAWCRLRIGIGAAFGDPADYVLTRFDAREHSVMDQAYRRAADAVECWIENGPELTMTRFNAEPPATSQEG
jgi:PTH1 family peptidyl-tRNA hydrolase